MRTGNGRCGAIVDSSWFCPEYLGTTDAQARWRRDVLQLRIESWTFAIVDGHEENMIARVSNIVRGGVGNRSDPSREGRPGIMRRNDGKRITSIGNDGFIPTRFDTLPPVITNIPGTVTVQIATGECEGVATWNEPVATDICSELTLTSDFLSGATFPSGSTTVTYTALDAEGNQAQASFVVTIIEPDAPVFTFVPESIIASADPLTCTQLITWADPVAEDANNCSDVVITSSVPQGEQFGIGVDAIVFTATDASGNTAVAFLNVTVSDDSPPVIEQLPTLILSAAPNTCDAVVDWIPPRYHRLYGSDGFLGCSTSTDSSRWRWSSSELHGS